MGLFPKKKKKKKLIDFRELADKVPPTVSYNRQSTSTTNERPWLARDLDQGGYLYNELLERIFKKIKLKEPASVYASGKIFIGGLSKQTTVSSLRTYFERFGELTNVCVLIDPITLQSRGFAF